MTYQPYPTGGGASDQAPMAERPPQPPSLRNAVRLMWAGAALGLLSAIISLAFASKIKNAVITAALKSNATARSEGKTVLTASQIHTLANATVVVLVVAGVIGILLWVWMAWANNKGRNWARMVATVLFALDTISFIFSFGRASLSIIFLALEWVVGLAAIVFLWRKDTTEYINMGPDALADDREALNLDQGVGVPEAGHPDGRHCRVVAAGQTPPDEADLAAVLPVAGQVGGVDGQAGQIRGRAAGRGQRGQQVREGLLELPGERGTDDRAGRVQGRLAGQEHQAPAGGDHRVREPGRAGSDAGLTRSMLMTSHLPQRCCLAPPELRAAGTAIAVPAAPSACRARPPAAGCRMAAGRGWLMAASARAGSQSARPA